VKKCGLDLTRLWWNCR